MPAKKGPVNAIPYGRKGIIPATCAQFEKNKLEKIETDEYSEYNISRNKVQTAVVKRRKEQNKNEKHQIDFDDVKKYLSLKIRDKEQKIKFYQNKLKDTRQEREDLITRLQAEQDQLKQSHEYELAQLTNTLKANKQKKDALATVAAMEIQLNREIAEAEATLKREKAQQSQQTSQALAEFYMLHMRQQRELKEGVEREKAKNRGMTSQNLEKTVIEMMRDIDSQIKEYSSLVMEARDIADVNSKLTKINKQKYMERDLLQQECDSCTEKINKNDMKIRKLVEELRAHDQKLSGGGLEAGDIIEEVEEAPEETNNQNSLKARDLQEEEKFQQQEQQQQQQQQQQVQDNRPKVDREALLNKFFENAVNVLCNSVVIILGILDPSHKEDYTSFHDVFNTFEGKKKELRFLMSKLGNLSFISDDMYRLPAVGLEDVEGADEEIAAKKIVEPQQKAIREFAQPIAEDELPELIATHFFQ
ncbi:hypothetical protein TRFO_10993 [Tritrichomonas foetus]|uniref:Uncharacterized protein n=1 Tax=Tritrichomonas foetus TaxID=1144522 RepID=A0A1J4J5W3_9EUKA|nr:hypothetical protein TRFO_10993 [Tritrichomonas foetus]|eukprot:OHS94618.1 hypothetical protein TRFO_10993 [Tritrichomonas foetus]